MNKFNAKELEKLEWNAKNHHPQEIRATTIGGGGKVGKEFHLIMQQIGLGLPVEPFLKQYPQIAKWVEVVKPFLELPGAKQWNANLQYFYKKQLVHANYDLIIYQNNQAIGMDWTIQRPPNFEGLENSFHTQLRLFLLQHRTQLPPEQINLVYLFANQPDVYQFTYSHSSHLGFKHRLESILGQFAEEEIHQEIEQESLNILHQKWVRGEITIKEYFDAIPEVEL
jgi:hypothetical protein